MTESPSFVGVPPDSSGKRIDCFQITRVDNMVVHRQAVVLADPQNPANAANVTAAGAVQVDNSGVTQPIAFAPGLAQLSSVPVVISASGDNTIIAGASGLRVKLYRLLLVADGLTYLTFKNGATALSGAIPVYTGGGLTLDLSGEPWYQTTAGQDLVLNSANAVAMGGTAYYVRS